MNIKVTDIVDEHLGSEQLIKFGLVALYVIKEFFSLAMN